MKKDILKLFLTLNTTLLVGESSPLCASSTSLSASKNYSKKAHEIANILIAHALTYDVDKKLDHLPFDPSIQLTGQEALIQKIEAAIIKQQPILLNCVGFPYKSMNTKEKVLAPTIDYAERHSLEFINNLCKKISKNLYSQFEINLVKSLDRRRYELSKRFNR